ncbi:MAG: GH92 family glycosyl hydrolase [Bacteroidales bacterium]|jgi:predicted alpha-1,2-mannosidase|nr:GH92 family glycosyl hydrolase [Bacteroidales bacterium]NLM92556.1 glycoside hydrolase family 92 protein [Bacteroidales bacterium]
MIKTPFLLSVFVLSYLFPVHAQVTPLYNLVPYVNPFIGTQKMGHTFPGATVPFGSVQLSPDTDTIPMYDENGNYIRDVYAYCAGYQYDDPTIVGFSHTHFSGTGHSDLGDILLMPTVGELKLNPGTADKPASGYRSAYSKDNEAAEPNYYRVLLDDYQVLAELTTTTRVGMHRYTFPATNQAHLILDMVHGIYPYEGKNVWTFLRVENDTLVTGYRMTTGWARTRTVYFAMAFSKPFREYGFHQAKKEPYVGFWRRFDQTSNFPEAAARELRGHFNFEMQEGEKLLVKVAISSVSASGALQNMQTEAPHWDFDRVKKQGQDCWNDELNKVQVETLTEGEKVNFYTSIYHSFLGPTEYMDVDGRYKGLDQEIHQADGFINYTSFSLWDTYRALHPLFNILQPARNRDMIRSMLAHYGQSVHKMLPVWSHYANENWCMIGYHSVSVIADALAKGIGGFDPDQALEACVNTARNQYYDALPLYMELGFVPEDKSSNSASKTLEFAYNDWCIAQVAEALGRTDIYEEFMARSENFKNLFDHETGFMRPRLSDGAFVTDFDPLDTHGQGFIEGNAWNYGLYVPHNLEGLVSLKGGKEKFATFLDELFTMTLPDKYFEQTEDVTREGIIGNYVHGNEPSHHIPFLYYWTDEPWKTQERVRMIGPLMYHPAPDGLGGNDDFGQMSAWYIFNALGFYPVLPGSDQYVIGSPSVVSADVKLENGKVFSVRTVNQSEENVYIMKITLNGKPLDRHYIRHQEITDGGELVFYLGRRPLK